MSELKICLLGDPCVKVNAEEIHTDRRKAIALLAYLAVSGKAHSRESLATLFWQDYDTSSAYAYLRRTIWELNQALGEGWLAVERDSLALDQDRQIWLDVDAFQKLAECTRSPVSEQLALGDLEQAATLYRGDFMEAFNLPDSPGFDEWQLFQREALRQTLAGVLKCLSMDYMDLGDTQKAIETAQRWVKMDPIHEPAHRQLMLLYARAGQRSAAIRQYQNLEDLLQREMGLEPDAQTARLLEEIRKGNLSGELPDSRVSTTPARISEQVSIQVSPTPATGLPTFLTPFVGRQEEMAKIASLLRDPACRLLTLVGPGGIGKTRLAVQSAELIAEDYRNGVTFVSLAGLSTGDDILPALIKALQFSYYEQSSQPRQQILNYLRTKNQLLILDNFEHVISDENIKLIIDIISIANELDILVTSRSILNLQGEQLYPLAGMNIPTGDVEHMALADWQKYSALQLFIQCAQRAHPGFELEEHNMHPVVRICQTLQGMPLAIELAATWLEVLTVDEIAEEILRSLDFLETDQRDIPQRQRSIRAVFETTMKHLTPKEQDIFRRLSIFQGGFSREAAKSVADANLRDLANLTRKSLLQHDEHGRYKSHELLRQYGFEMLTQDVDAWWDVRDRQGSYYASFLTSMRKQTYGSGQIIALRSIDQEIENINLAWQWMIIQREYERMWQVILGVIPYFFHSQFNPIFDQFADTAIEMLEDENSDEQLALNLLATLLVLKANSYYELTTGRPVKYCERAEMLYQQSGNLPDLGPIYSLFGSTYGWYVDPHRGIDYLKDSLSIAQKKGGRWEIAISERLLGELLYQIREFADAKAYIEDASQIFFELGDYLDYANCLITLGFIAGNAQDINEALNFQEQAMEIYEELGDKNNIGICLYTRGHLYVSLGDYQKAIEHYRAAEEIMHETGFVAGTASMLSWQSITAMRMGDLENARELRQKSLDLSVTTENTTDIVWGHFEMGEILRLQGDLDAARDMFQSSFDLFQESKLFSLRPFYYRGMGDLALANGDPHEAREHFSLSLKYALEEYHTWIAIYARVCLARSEILLGDLESAQEQLDNALQATQNDANIGLKMLVLAGYAELYAALEKHAEAAEFASLILENPGSWHEIQGIAADVLKAVAGKLPGNLLAEAQKRGRDGKWEETVAHLLVTSQTN